MSKRKAFSRAPRVDRDNAASRACIPRAHAATNTRGAVTSSRLPIPQGTLDMLILQIVSLEPLHGYAVAQRLLQVSREAVQVNQGSLYPALHRLEQKRWLRSEWRTSETGREAKYYTLTAAGRRQLAVEKAGWDRLASAVQLIFNEAE